MKLDTFSPTVPTQAGLEQFDLHAMKHNSADYIHTVVEALKLAYADRDSYYGDPARSRLLSHRVLMSCRYGDFACESFRTPIEAHIAFH